MGCHPLLQENFPTQGLNPCLLHWQAGSLRLSHQGSPFPTSRVTYASHVCGKSLHVSVVRWGSMLSLIKGWGDLSRLSQPRDVKYSNNGFMNIKNSSENWVSHKSYSVYKPQGMYSNERTKQDRNVFLFSAFQPLSLALLGDIPVLHLAKGGAGRAADVRHPWTRPSSLAQWEPTCPAL